MVQWTISSDERAEHERGAGRKLRLGLTSFFQYPIAMARTEADVTRRICAVPSCSDLLGTKAATG